MHEGEARVHYRRAEKIPFTILLSERHCLLLPNQDSFDCLYCPTQPSVSRAIQKPQKEIDQPARRAEFILGDTIIEKNIAAEKSSPTATGNTG